MDEKLFECYIKSIVTYLHHHPSATYYLVDTETDAVKFVSEILDLNLDTASDDSESNPADSGDAEKDLLRNISDRENFAKKPQKTPKTKNTEKLFGGTLRLKRGKVNDLYLAIDKIYNKLNGDATVLPVIGMSMRLLLETAARVNFEEKNKRTISITDKNIYTNFIKSVKKELEQDSSNYILLVKNWLSGDENIEGILGKYAHSQIPYDKSNIITVSKIVAFILNKYYKG